jgi:hypothetical protein
MKKKMLFMAAIAGLFVLGSCVKDDVSGSVEAVRQAKANQLNGLANQANANAALLNAQAAHENAIIAADAALKQAQAASAQAQAQIDQMDAQLKGDALAAELADKLADFEANTATNKAILQNQLNALQIALRNAATSNYDDIAALIANYRTAYNDFTLAEQNLINAKVGLETAEINAKYAEDVAAAMILGLEQDIDRYTKELEALEAVDQKGISTPKQALAAGDALQGAIDIATAEFAESPAIGAFLDAAAAWYKAYKAYLDYNDPTNGVFAKLNTATNAAVGKDYYTNIGTKDVAKAAIAAFGLADYSTYADPFVFGGNTEVSPAIAKVTVDQYRVLEEGKLLTDNYLKTYTKTQSDALKAAKDAKADLEGQLGKEGDKKDTKYKDAVTLYGALAGATEVYDKAAKAEADAKKAMADKPAAVQAALDALVAENSKKTVDDAKWIAAVVTLADAVVDAYGAPAYDPNLKKYATPANDQDAIDYLIGVKNANTLGYTKAWMQDPDNVKLLFKNGDANCIVTKWASDASKKDATEVAKVEDVANRDAKAVNVIAAYKAAQNDTKTAKTAKDAAQKAVNDQPQKIAAAQDQINVAQDNLDNADAKKAELEGLIAACDTEAYQEVIDAVATATDDYNQALIDLFAARQELTDLEDEQAACYAVATQNVDVLIANAKANLATAEENLATWKANNTQEQIIAAAKKNVSDAQAEVEIATAALLAAQQDLKDANIEFDLTDDDEPTEEPTEEPTVVEEPAEEGGEG